MGRNALEPFDMTPEREALLERAMARARKRRAKRLRKMSKRELRKYATQLLESLQVTRQARDKHWREVLELRGQVAYLEAVSGVMSDLLVTADAAEKSVLHTEWVEHGGEAGGA